jgi:hypothetical protein
MSVENGMETCAGAGQQRVGAAQSPSPSPGPGSGPSQGPSQNQSQSQSPGPSCPMRKNTRQKTIDLASLGKKKSLSDVACHQCRTMLQGNDENICRGTEQQLPHRKNQANALCKKRYCTGCLSKHYPEMLKELRASKVAAR